MACNLKYLHNNEVIKNGWIFCCSTIFQKYCVDMLDITPLLKCFLITKYAAAWKLFEKYYLTLHFTCIKTLFISGWRCI